MSESGPADLSRLHVVVPLRTLEGGKSRLGEALDAEERGALVVGMLCYLLDAVRAWGAAEAVHVVSPDRTLLHLAAAAGANPIRQREGDLNAGLRLARTVALAGGATALLVLPADLPLVAPDALARFLDAADAALAAGSGHPLVAIAAADARGGTNALLLAPPGVIELAFGPDSLERHLREAAAAGATVQIVTDPALAFDLDTPDDLDRLEPWRLADLQALGEPYVVGPVQQPAPTQPGDAPVAPGAARRPPLT